MSRPFRPFWAILALWIWAIGSVPDSALAQTISGVVRNTNGPAAETVVSLEPLSRAEPATKRDTLIIDQAHLRFEPGIVAVRRGTSVEFLNSDPIMHNVFSPGGRGAGFDLGTYVRGESRHFEFDRLGRHVILCHVHPEMVAWVIVVDTPYFTTTDEIGHFSLDGVAPGQYRLRLWHRRWGETVRELTVTESENPGLNLEIGSTR